MVTIYKRHPLGYLCRDELRDGYITTNAPVGQIVYKGNLKTTVPDPHPHT